MNKYLQNLVARGALIAVLTACGAGGDDKKSSETGTTAQPMLAALPTLAVPLVASDTAETVTPLPTEAVTVYSDSDFAGASEVLAIGIYVAKDGKLAQLDDNSVRSLKIPPLFLARLCDNADGSGDCWTFGGGDHSAIGSKLDKKASRIEVIKVNTQIKTAADVQAAVSLGGDIQLPTDVYYFDKPIEISISNTRLNGNGSTFVFSDRFKNAVIVQTTKGVVLENFSLDYNPLPFTQGVVTAITDNNFDLNIDEGYSADPRLFIVDGAPEPWGYGQRPGIAVINSNTNLLKYDASKTWANSLISPSARVLRVGVNPKDSNIQIGDSIVVLAPWWACAVQINGSSESVVKNVNIWSSPGGGVCQNGGGGASQIDKLSIVPGPIPSSAKRARLMATNRDGVHIRSVARGITLENSTISSISDDGFNNETVMSTITSVNGKQIKADPNWAEPNDIANIYSPDLKFKKSVKMLSYEGSNITLESAENISVGDRLVNISRSGAGTVVRNNVFKNIEARGILLRGSGGRIEGNVIERTGISGIWVGAEIGFYAEGDFAHDVVIENNTLRDVGGWRSQGGNHMGAISVMSSIDDNTLATAALGHRQNTNIIVRNNTVTGTTFAGLLISDTSRASVCDNQFSATNNLQFNFGANRLGINITTPLMIIDSADISLWNNSLGQPGSFGSKQVYIDATAERVQVDNDPAKTACQSQPANKSALQ